MAGKGRAGTGPAALPVVLSNGRQQLPAGPVVKAAHTAHGFLELRH